MLIFFLIASVNATDVNTNDTKTLSSTSNDNNDNIVSVKNDLNAPNTDTNTYSKSSAKISSKKNTNNQMSIENNLDASSNDKSTNSNKASTKNNNQIVSAKNNLNLLTENEGTYSDLKTEIVGHSGNITLARKNYRYTSDDGSTSIEIGPNTIINGNGAIIDMRESSIQAFYVSGSNVTIKNLTIKNTQANVDGGAICFKEESCTVENCNFINNQGNWGGALVFHKAGNVTNCNFTDNKAQNGRGGAIHFYSSTGTITNCNFINNQGNWGGAILFNGNGNVINCNFTNNTASYGGAIRFNGDGTLTNCNFKNNNASNNGGAVYFDKTSYTGTVTKCNFTNNTAKDGGAMRFNSKGTVTNCNFNNNNASENGGAIGFNRDVNAIKCNFNNNTAKNGGAIQFDGPSTVTNCTFNNNNASNLGGAIFFKGDTSTVTKSVFINNTASTNGDAIYKNGDIIINHNIFLNKDLNNVIYCSGDSNLDYNWFGNTAKNYTKSPSVVGVTLNNWLFLNATLNDMSTINPIDVFSTNNITFKLFLYNSSKQENNVSEYDNNLLYPANLMIHSEKGSVSSDSAKLGEKIVYTPNNAGSDSVSASIEGVSYTITLTAAKINPKLSINPSTATYLDPITLTLQYHDKATGKVNITLNSANNKYSYSLLNQDLNTKISLASLDIKPEEYTVTVKYSGDNNFVNTTASSTLTVNKKEYTTNIQDLTVTPLYLDKPALIEGYLYANNEGLMKQKISLNISTSKGYKIYNLTTDQKGKFQITIKPDTLGIITIKVTYPGNTTPEYIYKTTSANITSNTEKIYYNITFDPLQTSYDYNTTITITGTVTSNYQPLDIDNVNVTLNNGAPESVKLNNNKFTYKFKSTIIGLNNITINCKDATNTTKTFIKYPTKFTITNIPNTTTNKAIIIIIKESNRFTGTINVKIGNKYYKVQLQNGSGKQNIKINTPGTYIASIKFPGNQKYTKTSTISNKFTVKYPTQFIISKIPNITQGTPIKLTVTEKNKYTGPVIIIIGSEKYTIKLTNGLGKKTINPKLAPGKYLARIKFDGNKKYTPTTTVSNKFQIKPKTVVKLDTKIIAFKKTFYLEDTNKKYNIILKDVNGRFIRNATVTLKINRKTYKTKTNNKGLATFDLKDLAQNGTYTSIIQYMGDKNYKASHKKVKITVNILFKTVSRGSKDKDTVIKIQEALKNHGYYLHAGKHYLKIDGIYYIWTEKEVKRYQKNNKLPVTGKVDYQTALKLGII